MVRRLVLEALARAAHGDPNPYALRSSDPIVRAIGKRRVRRALFEAERLTAITDPRHAARLAFVKATDALPEGSLDDADAIARAFERAGGDRVDARRGGPWLTLGIALAALFGSIGLAIAVVLARPYDPKREPVGRALGETLPGYIVALSRNAGAAPPPAVAPDLARALGDDAARAWDAMIASMGAVARSPASKDDFFASVGSLDATLARSRAPFFLDADVLAQPSGATWPMVYSFYVDRERAATSDSSKTSIRVLYVWRLDSLALSQPFLGYTHPRAAAALVLLDQIERELIDYVLPPLKQGEPVGLLDEASVDANAAWQAALDARAAEIVRAAFSGDADAAALARIGDLLARRRAIVRKWQRELPLVGVQLVPPRRLVPEGDYAGELRHRASKASLSEWDDIHDELLRPRTIAVFERLRDRFARSTERHEVQHRIDYARGLVPVPELLAKRLALESTLDLPPASFAAHCRDETSAYLAQMADAADPALTLMLLTHFLFDKDDWGSAYSCAAQIVVELVGRALAVPDAESPIVRYGSVVREALAARFLAITERSADEIRGAARRAWESGYGGTLAKVSSTDFARHETWRH